MRKEFLTIFLLLSAIFGYAQTNTVVGSWIWRDSKNAISLFIKPDGVIEKRTGKESEYIWNKAPETGTYTFNSKKGLVITWKDKHIEMATIKFIDNFTASMSFKKPKSKITNTYIFKKIVDEEVIPD